MHPALQILAAFSLIVLISSFTNSGGVVKSLFGDIEDDNPILAIKSIP
jgi:hypothetical protein